MAEAMIGEIRAFPFSYAPYGWLDCNGQLLLVQQYPALYATIGIAYGGNGQTNFNVPNLQGRTAGGAGQSPGLSYYTLGQALGYEGVQLTSSAQLPLHNHTLQLQTLGLGQEPQDFTAAPQAGVSYATRYWYNLAQRPAVSYVAHNPVPPATGIAVPQQPVNMSSSSLTPFGGAGQAHENRQPYLPLRFCICWDGYFMPNPG